MTLKRHINDIKRGNKGTLFCNKGPLLAGKCCLFAILRLVIDSQCGCLILNKVDTKSSKNYGETTERKQLCKVFDTYKRHEDSL